MKRLLAFLLILCLALAAVSCTGDSNEEQTAAKTATESATESAPTTESISPEMTKERAIRIVNSIPTLKTDISKKFKLFAGTVEFRTSYASENDDGSWDVQLFGVASGSDGMNTKSISFSVRATVSRDGRIVSGPSIQKKS